MHLVPDLYNTFAITLSHFLNVSSHNQDYFSNKNEPTTDIILVNCKSIIPNHVFSIGQYLTQRDKCLFLRCEKSDYFI